CGLRCFGDRGHVFDVLFGKTHTACDVRLGHFQLVLSRPNADSLGCFVRAPLFPNLLGNCTTHLLSPHGASTLLADRREATTIQRTARVGYDTLSTASGNPLIAGHASAAHDSAPSRARKRRCLTGCWWRFAPPVPV